MMGVFLAQYVLLSPLFSDGKKDEVDGPVKIVFVDEGNPNNFV